MVVESLASTSQRKCVLVLGMHRSGTSALSGVLASLGLQRPRREMPPKPDNEKGFFEPIEIVAIHDRFLASFGSHWADWRGLPLDWTIGGAFASALDELEHAVQQDFDGSGTFLVKDPRACRFVELWLKLAERLDLDLIAVHAFRNPNEVAASLRARDGMDEAAARLLWLRHVLNSEASTRNLSRTFVSYTDLVQDGLVELAPTLANLGLDIANVDDRRSQDAESFIEAGLRRQRIDPGVLYESGAQWIRKAFEALGRFRQSPYDKSAMELFDHIRSQLDSACEAIWPAFAAVQLQIESLDREVATLRSLEGERRVLLQSLKSVTWVAERIALTEDVDRGIASELNLDALHARLAATEQLSSFKDKLAIASSELDAVRELSVDLKNQNDRLLQERDRFSDRCAVLEAELEIRGSEVAKLSHVANHLPSVESQLSAARDRLEKIETVADRVLSMEAALHVERKQNEAMRKDLRQLRQIEQERDALASQLVLKEVVEDRVLQLEYALAEAHKKLNSPRELARRLFLFKPS